MERILREVEPTQLAYALARKIFKQHEIGQQGREGIPNISNQEQIEQRIWLTMRLEVMAISRNYHKEDSSVANITKCISKSYNPRQYKPNHNMYEANQKNGIYKGTFLTNSYKCHKQF